MLERDMKALEFDKIKAMLEAQCITYMGKDLAKSLVPSTNLQEVAMWQEETSQAVSLILRKGAMPILVVEPFDTIFQKLTIGAVLSMRELLQIASLLSGTRRLKYYFKEDLLVEENYSILKGYFEALYTNPSVEEEILRCIKSEDLMEDRASKTLYDIRRQIADSEGKIRDKLNSLMRKNAKYLQESVVTFRNDRYVIPVKQEYKNEVPGLIHDASGSGSTIFIEPMAVFEINNEVKELRMKEQVEIERILSLLTQMVSPLKESMEESLEILGKIDFASGKAKLSLAMEAFEPKINDKHHIHLKKARHPLISKEQVVPIDIWIGKSFKVLIITGPNTGGKTVALKTVGLFCMMAQSGLHIPAMESSEVSVFDAIYSDIGDEQSIEQSLSTFSSHMKNVVNILSDVTPNSLVLLDELGSGTDPIEGAALATAILQKLFAVGALTVATTHYSELKTFALQTEGVENASCEFDVESLRPTYKLLIGIPGKSNAFAISKKLGLSDEIIQNAESMLSEESIHFEDILGDMERDRRVAREERELSDKLLAEAKQQSEKSKIEHDHILKKKEEIIQKAREEARDLLLEAKEEADDIINELSKLKSHQGKDVGKKAEEAREKMKASISKMQKELVLPSHEIENPIDSKKIQAGLKVFLPLLEEEGTILGKPDRKENVMVQIGLLKMNVHVSQIQEIREKSSVVLSSARHKGKISGNQIASKAMDISTEINLIGQNVDEAVAILDKYLDDAYLASLKTVRIVHGKGTGALRKGVQEYLKKHPHVKSYRNGLYGEGENGVTIVELT